MWVGRSIGPGEGDDAGMGSETSCGKEQRPDCLASSSDSITHCVIFGELLNLSEPQFLHL